MEIINLPNDLPVFGHEVRDFPSGVNEAFGALVERVPGGFTRSFFGVFQMVASRMSYLVTAEEKAPGEGKSLGYEAHVIRKGNYATLTLKDWRANTSKIESMFTRLMQEEGIDSSHPSVEWYKNEDEMHCMMRLTDK